MFNLEKGVHTEKRTLPILVILTIIPAVYLVAVVILCAVDVPMADQWDFVPLLEKSVRGHVTLGDLTSQHNEHRLFFPRLIMLTLARLSHWNIAYELTINLVLGVGIFLMIFLFIRRSIQQTGFVTLKWTIPIASLILFSLNQWENWLWGWQIQIFLCVLCIVGGIYFLSAPEIRWWRLGLAITLGGIAAFSFANGFVFLGIGAGMILAHQQVIPPKTRWLRFLVWAAASTVIAWLYLYRFHLPAHHSGFLGFLKFPQNYAIFVIKFIGSPLTHYNRNAVVLGIFGICVFIFLLWKLYTIRAKIQTIFPILALSVYSLSSGMLTGLGRAKESHAAAMSPRYTSFSNFFWISLIILFFIVMAHKKQNRTAEPHKRISLTRWIAYGVIVVILYHTVSVTVKSTHLSLDYKNFLIKAQNALRHTPEETILIRLYPPGPYGVINRLPFLKQQRLSLFRGQGKLSTFKQDSRPSSARNYVPQR